MTECGADRFRSIEAEPYGYGPIAKPRTTSDPCPGYFYDGECTGTDITWWEIKRDELLDERNKLLAELRAAGCVWPQDLEESITTTDGYALRYSEEWGFFRSGLGPLYASMFGVELEKLVFTNVVQINLELISRLTCEIERLALLNVAQDCGADRPYPVIAKKRSSWLPAAVGAGLVVALVAGLRLGRSLR